MSNYELSTLKKLKLDYDSLSQINPVSFMPFSLVTERRGRIKMREGLTIQRHGLALGYNIW